jgi:FtsH-binding integral membrane protein
MVLLAGFTVCESVILGGITSQYDKNIVAMAGLATALVTISLTVYAWRTTVKIEVFAALAFVVYLAMLPMAIIGYIFMSNFLYTLYMCLGLVFYSLYLIIDTIIICGKEKHNGVAMDHNDYVIGALMLYIDIVMIFVYILRLLGNSK